MPNPLAFSIPAAILMSAYPAYQKHLINKNISYKTVLGVTAAVFFFWILVFILLNIHEIVGDMGKLSYKDMALIFSVELVVSVTVAVVSLYLLTQMSLFSMTAMFTALAPIVTICFAFFVLKEKVTLRAFIGFCLIFTGLTLTLSSASSLNKAQVGPSSAG
jgi:drug/metabolite transporter (DMT)-like permease